MWKECLTNDGRKIRRRLKLTFSTSFQTVSPICWLAGSVANEAIEKAIRYTEPSVMDSVHGRLKLLLGSVVPDYFALTSTRLQRQVSVIYLFPDNILQNGKP